MSHTFQPSRHNSTYKSQWFDTKLCLKCTMRQRDCCIRPPIREPGSIKLCLLCIFNLRGKRFGKKAVCRTHVSFRLISNIRKHFMHREISPPHISPSTPPPPDLRQLYCSLNNLLVKWNVKKITCLFFACIPEMVWSVHSPHVDTEREKNWAYGLRTQTAAGFPF